MNATSQYLNRPLRTYFQARCEWFLKRIKHHPPKTFPKLVKRFNPPIEPLESLDP